MRRRPKGTEYRNLTVRGSVIYYEKRTKGKPSVKLSLETDDWEVAVAARDELKRTGEIDDAEKGSTSSGSLTLADIAPKALATDGHRLARTTREDRERHLALDGPIMPHLGHFVLDEITPAMLREWWEEVVVSKKRTTKTGRNYLDSLSSVFAYANGLDPNDPNPVADFRPWVRRQERNQKGRAATDPGRNVHAIEDAAQLQLLVEAAREESPRAYVLVLLLLDGGLRVGEALGLRWDKIAWKARSLRIEESRSRGGPIGPTKSGRVREVELSKRLAAALRELQIQTPDRRDDSHVLSFQPDNFRKREWRRILKRAGIGHRRLKDLRDTYASQLLSAGIQLGYVSLQLGHGDVSITARHYARWCGSGYRAPLELRPGEVPADLLGRLAGRSRQQAMR